MSECDPSASLRSAPPLLRRGGHSGFAHRYAGSTYAIGGVPAGRGGHFFYVLMILLLVFAANLTHADTPQLPPNLQWQTNDTDPIFADPNAKRGGRFRAFTLEFPATLRTVGPDSNSSFAIYLTDNMLSLIGRHPNTLNPLPELATHWAFGSDGKTIYFKLDPEARWSDGVPVTADDYVFTLEFMRSKFIVAPFSNDYFTNVIANIEKLDDYTISVTGAHVKPPEELIFELNIPPVPKHFHKLNERWVENYNWRIEPNTGPYQIDSIRKGKYIEFKRKPDWWANNKRYFEYRYNPDFVRVKIIRDFNIAYNYFTKGELDSYVMLKPRVWYKKAKGPIFDNGFAGKITYYTDPPQPPMGMFLNQDDPILKDKNVRLGFCYAMNVDKMIATVLRGDYDRLQGISEGYGDYTNRRIKARPFDLAKADYYLNLAGWSKRGNDGIRVKGGQRLSLRVSYGTDDHTARLVMLKEEALKAGIELVLQLRDGISSYKEMMEKKHQIAWSGWTASGIAPEYWQQFHSDNAHKPQTNNITNTDNPELDRKIDAYRSASTKSERVKLAHQIQQIIFDEASFVPTYKVPFLREGFWRWLKTSKEPATRSTPTYVFDPFGSTGGLFWIDEQEKEKVQKARILGEKFPPINILDETWRVKPE
jgi:microcin C transport system substrate-binding protein